MAVNQVFLDGEEKPVIDLTQDTVTPDSLLEGVTAHDSSGEVITGTFNGVKDVVDSYGDSLVTDGVAHLPEYLENTAEGESEFNLTIGGEPANGETSVNVGKNSRVATEGTAVGYRAVTEQFGGTAIGKLANTKENYGVAVGYSAVAAADNCIQMGYGECTENNTANFGGREMVINKITRFDRNVQRTVECVCMDEIAPRNFNYSGAKGMMSISDDGNYLYVHNGREWRQIPLSTFIYNG